MCAPPELFAAACAVITLPLIGWSTYLQRAFNRSLQARYPSVWAQFGTKGYFKFDESPVEAAAGWYLLTGQYHELSDQDLDGLGNRARWTTLVGILVMGVGLLATSHPKYESVFACLPW